MPRICAEVSWQALVQLQDTKPGEIGQVKQEFVGKGININFTFISHSRFTKTSFLNSDANKNIKPTIMKKYILLSMMLSTFLGIAQAQQTSVWAEADRQFLVRNMKETRDELIKETSGLSKAQWNFKESPDRWSISQIVEHIAFWELILQREISVGMKMGPIPEWQSLTNPDSGFVSFIYEEKKHLSNDYTWPFTYSQPMGLNRGEDNMAWFLKMRNEGIEYLASAKEDLRRYFRASRSSNIHQTFITTYGHSARHLRQIINVKKHPGYPRK